MGSHHAFVSSSRAVGAGDELAHWLRSKVGSRAVDLLADQADGADGNRLSQKRAQAAGFRLQAT